MRGAREEGRLLFQIKNANGVDMPVLVLSLKPFLTPSASPCIASEFVLFNDFNASKFFLLFKFSFLLVFNASQPDLWLLVRLIGKEWLYGNEEIIP